MKLVLDPSSARHYDSESQRIRVMTEKWVEEEIFCPRGHRIERYENNKPVADFYCQNCHEDFELKSKSGVRPLNLIVDGAYSKMMERLRSATNPNLFVLNYEPRRFEVVNFFLVPKYFFVPEIIEKRKPLSPTARRAGWVGCNINLGQIPQQGKIYYVREEEKISRKTIFRNWTDTLFLRKKQITSRGWVLDVMHYIDKLNKKEFALEELYRFEKELNARHPANRHVRDKIRQQLQILRDQGYLQFVKRGVYKLQF